MANGGSTCGYQPYGTTIYRRQADTAKAFYVRLLRGRHDAESLRLRGNLNNMRTGERSADAAMGHLSPEGDDSRLCPQTDVFYLKVGETVVVQYSVRGRVSPRTVIPDAVCRVAS